MSALLVSRDAHLADHPRGAALQSGGRRWSWCPYGDLETDRDSNGRPHTRLGAPLPIGTTAAAPDVDQLRWSWSPYGARGAAGNAPGLRRWTTVPGHAHGPLETRLRSAGSCEVYESELEPPGTANEGTAPMTTLAVGQVSFKTTPGELRWVIKRLTGVTVLKVEQHRNRERERTGLFLVQVAPHDVDRVLSAHRSALCCRDFLWVPRASGAAVNQLAHSVKAEGLAKNGLLSVEQCHHTRVTEAAPVVPVNRHTTTKKKRTNETNEQ